MARFERVALLAFCGATVAACNLIAGLDHFQDVSCEPCGDGSVEAGGGDVLIPPPQDAAPDAGEDVFIPVDASDAGDASDADTGSDADAGESGGAVAPEGGPPYDYRWARWVMPNGAEAGLPNPASYAPLPGIDGGVLDLRTRLMWGPTQAAATADAGAALCASPWRVPTRIELVSILDTSSQTGVLVNPAFATMQQAKYWTSSVTLTGQSWTVDFGEGSVTAPATGLAHATAVVCVQSPLDGGPP